MGYVFYGGFSFGLTEFLKRRFVELAGPDLAALYPIPILLGARCVCRAGVKRRGGEVCRGVRGWGERGSAGVGRPSELNITERMLGLVPARNHSCCCCLFCCVLLVSRVWCVDAPAPVVAVAVAALLLLLLLLAAPYRPASRPRLSPRSRPSASRPSRFPTSPRPWRVRCRRWCPRAALETSLQVRRTKKSAPCVH